MTYMVLLAASFGYVFLKAWQQRNVAFDHVWWVLPTSYAMAVVEVIVVTKIVMTGGNWLAVFVLGTGGGFGALTAMWFHKTFLTRRE
ncbi:hypothetical protein [Pyruvatibacter sp.]